MGLEVLNGPPLAVEALLKSTPKPAYLIVLSSFAENGAYWCGDCRKADPYIRAKFDNQEGFAKVVYAGSKAEWKDPGNPWRQTPFSITHLPTIIKITEDGKFERLIEDECYNEQVLDAFVDVEKSGAHY
ncbi:hypothetical protein BGZ60DRAFT_401488 [Tricladium varicosporioides]|nr:hypothetical protein BGZ60DRAFT_401488 [Hymenoscyphus varicosporioides]